MGKKQTSKRTPRGIVLDGPSVCMARKLKAMSQEDLAKHAGVSVKTIQRAESGAAIRLDFWGFIAEALDVSRGALLSDEHIKEKASQAKTNEPRMVVKVWQVEFPLGMSASEFVERGYVKQFFADLQVVGLIKEGVNDAKAEDGSIVISGEVTRSDANRLVRAYLAGKLDYLNVESIMLSPALANNIQFHEPLPTLTAKRRRKRLIQEHLIQAAARATPATDGKDLPPKKLLATEIVERLRSIAPRIRYLREFVTVGPDAARIQLDRLESENTSLEERYLSLMAMELRRPLTKYEKLDCWDHLMRLVEATGPERPMWRPD